MKRRVFLRQGGMAAIAGTALAAQGCSKGDEPGLGSKQIQHGVIFSLLHPEESREAATFLEDGKRILSGIPVVKNFQAFRQVSPKNDYQYGFTMVFESGEDYTTYNEHPDHVAFVEERWKKEVKDFLEIDFRRI